MLINALGYDSSRSILVPVWENSTPDSSFGSYIITGLDLTKYSFLYIVFLLSTTEKVLFTSMLKNDPSAKEQWISCRSNEIISRRQVTIEDNNLKFSAAYSTELSASGPCGTKGSAIYAIPYRIYGVERVQ